MAFQAYLDRENDDKIDELRSAEYRERVVTIFEAANYNFAMREINAGLNLKKMARKKMSKSLWLKQCRFTKKSPEAKSSQASKHYERLDETLYPQQAHAVFWMLKKERSTAGRGFLRMRWA